MVKSKCVADISWIDLGYFMTNKKNKLEKYWVWSFYALNALGALSLWYGVDVGSNIFYLALSQFYNVFFSGLEGYRENKQFDQSVTGFYLLLFIWLPLQMYMGLLLFLRRSRSSEFNRDTKWMLQGAFSASAVLALIGFGLGKFEGRPLLCDAQCSNLTLGFFLLFFLGVWQAIYFMLTAFAFSLIIVCQNLIGKFK